MKPVVLVHGASTSSMQSPPAIIECTSVMALRPGAREPPQERALPSGRSQVSQPQSSLLEGHFQLDGPPITQTKTVDPG